MKSARFHDSSTLVRWDHPGRVIHRPGAARFRAAAQAAAAGPWNGVLPDLYGLRGVCGRMIAGIDQYLSARSDQRRLLLGFPLARCRISASGSPRLDGRGAVVVKNVDHGHQGTIPQVVVTIRINGKSERLEADARVT